MIPTGVPLQQWINDHPIGPDMLWKGAAASQLEFVRSVLPPVFGWGLAHEQMLQLATVISLHSSWSIRLPVYLLTRPDMDLQIVLRYNFFNWKMSVVSEKPIDADFSGLFHTTSPVDPGWTGNELASCYFEGFPNDLIFGYYAETDGRQWSAEISYHYHLWTTIYLIMRSQSVIGPLVWGRAEDYPDSPLALKHIAERIAQS